jgi:hypothetical protein
VTLVEPVPDRQAHEVVIDDFVNPVVPRSRERERHEQVDIQREALRAGLLVRVNADIGVHDVVTHEDAAAIGKPRIEQQRAHRFVSAAGAGSVRNITSRELATRCWPPSTSSVVPVTASAFAR